MDLLRWLRLARTRAAPTLEPLEVALTGHPLDVFGMRSEDVRFSPSGQLLAVATTQNRIMLFAVDVAARPVAAELLTALVSPSIQAPHGVDWVDEEHIVVASRRGELGVYRIPRANRWEQETAIDAISAVRSAWFGGPGEMRKLRERAIMTGPGSARVHDGFVYASCNKQNTVSRHRIIDGPSCDEGELVAQEGIEIPDSAAPSPDGAWLAVGDHDHNRVLIFRLGEKSPCGVLRDPHMAHPHGVAFDPTGTTLVVADAGGRGLYLWHAPSGAWDITSDAADSTTEGVAKDVFERVQSETAELVRHLEGGTKGVDFSKTGRVLVTTCRGQTLRFFALHDRA